MGYGQEIDSKGAIPPPAVSEGSLRLHKCTQRFYVRCAGDRL